MEANSYFLAFAHRDVMRDLKEEFDLFVYLEDDMELTWQQLQVCIIPSSAATATATASPAHQLAPRSPSLPLFCPGVVPGRPCFA